MPPAKLSPASPAFMLLGGISSLPSGTLVRGLLHKPKTTPQRYRDVEAEWDFFQLRTYGVGIPECASKMKRRSEASNRIYQVQSHSELIFTRRSLDDAFVEAVKLGGPPMSN
ncbi:hypothetical protein MY4038_010158, partial [Beauveria bassiana]